MLMVIFGAGASYDSASSFRPDEYGRDGVHWFRPPLANELFMKFPDFRGRLDRYTRCRPLVPRLEPPATGSLSLEEKLQAYEEDAKTDPERRRQLMAIQFYLRDLIGACESAWVGLTHGVSNYTTLLDDIRRYSQACLVTFNYDTLIERSLEDLGFRIGFMENYVHPKFPLIKLHGSIDWVQSVRVEGGHHSELQPYQLIEFVELLRPLGDIHKDGVNPNIYPEERLFAIPALAIP